MIGWPLYRLGKGLHKRGRLPDMKSRRITFSLVVIGLVLGFVFFVPLPLFSRIRQSALVELQPDAVEKVFVPLPGGILEHLAVKPGQEVQRGDVLARFRNIDLENRLADARSELVIREVSVRALQDRLQTPTDRVEAERIRRELAAAQREQQEYAAQVPLLERALRRLELRAPRSGVVLSPPLIDEVGKMWAPDQETKPFCSIGDPRHLRALVPVSPDDFRLLKDDVLHAYMHNREVPVTVRVQGRGPRTRRGPVAPQPEAEAKEVPLQLTTRGGGPLAVKPGGDPNVLVPQAQQYLVAVNILDPDDAICPGTQAQVKIHCRWRTCAWWVWRAISSTFDIGLL
jgi:putative peptide zinc metalloprotease protein